MEKTAVILMGLQGSGKSTFYKTHLKSEFIHVNLDTLKTRNREMVLIADCYAQEKSFAVDNTNPTKADRQRYIPSAKRSGYKIVGYFLESKVNDCIRRNEKRKNEERVPTVAIAATSNKLQLPSYDEGFDELYFVKNDGHTMTVERWLEP